MTGAANGRKTSGDYAVNLTATSELEGDKA